MKDGAIMKKQMIDDFINETQGRKSHKGETQEEKIARYMERLNLTEEEAINLIEWDKNETDTLDEIEKNKKVEYIKRKIEEQKEPQQKSKISDDEVERLYNKIVELSKEKPFDDWFTSKQLAPHVADFLGARQIRFRLDKLEQQKLILVENSKPKRYKLVD